MEVAIARFDGPPEMEVAIARFDRNYVSMYEVSTLRMQARLSMYEVFNEVLIHPSSV